MGRQRFVLGLLVASLLAWPAVADTLHTTLEDSADGKSISNRITKGQRVYHHSTSTVSLDAAVEVKQCGGGLDIALNPDFDGTNVTGTYTLYDCPRRTASANFATECVPGNFDPDGGGSDTNIMSDATDSLHVWGMIFVQGFFGATITNSGSDQVQVTITCKP